MASLGAGVFTHNQAAWYVQEVLAEAEEIEGGCKVSYIDWRVAPLATGFETPAPTRCSHPDGLASAPQGAAGGQGRDRRRQLHRHHPLHLGRRPRAAGTPTATTARGR